MRYYKIGAILFMLVLLRGPIFRLCFQYQSQRTIPLPALHEAALKQQIRMAVLSLPDDDIKAWAYFAQRFTAQRLQFSSKAKSSLPDKVWRSGEGHCVGYAALAGAVLREVVRQKGNSSKYKIEQVRADIYLFGFRLTGPNRAAFFRDHDYISVTNVESNHQLHFDPSLYDYLRIKSIQ